MSRAVHVTDDLAPCMQGVATILQTIPLTDRTLEPIREKVLAQERLSFDDGVALYRSNDILGIGALANTVRERLHGDAAYFVWNTHVNHTNVCVATCAFCAFAAKPGDERGYTMALDDVFEAVRRLPSQAREVHVVGGLHPDLPFSYFTDMLRGIREMRPDIHIKAFTAVEIFFFHRLYRRSVEDILLELKDAGLGSMPGGGAEIFAKETRDRVIRGKANAEQWLDVMRTAHRLGIPSNCTMLYGHVESVEDRVDHLLKLRALQDETGGFVTYIPLAFQPWEAPDLELPETTGFDDLKAIAVGRLMLDNIPHIKSLLDHDRAAARAGGLVVWRRRHRRHRDRGEDRPRRRRQDGPGHDCRRSSAASSARRDGVPSNATRSSTWFASGERAAVKAAPTREAPPAREEATAQRTLRLGVVPYLNVQPMVRSLRGEASVTLESAIPSDLAGRLHAGSVDLGTLPSVEYAFGDYALVPGVAIGSRGPVESVVLHHSRPLEEVRPSPSTPRAGPASRSCDSFFSSVWGASPTT